MTCRCEPSEWPDGFTGALLGLESFRDAVVVLHGPTGCRGPHSALSERMLPRDDPRERLNFAERYFFGQPRIPTTYLDGQDIVFGARDKLLGALRHLHPVTAGPLALVQSPGAALIGDDLRACAAEAMPGRPCAVVELPSLSRPFAEGYQQGVRAFLEAAGLPRAAVAPRTVALVGLSIAHAQWEGNVLELTRLLERCGLEVVCALGAGADLAACRRLASAAVVATVHRTYADRLEPWLRGRLPGSWVDSEAGAPIGFAATEAWVRAVAAAAGVEPAPALADLLDSRRRLARLLNLTAGSVDTLRGEPFALRLDADLAWPLAQWLYHYLGMLPGAVDVTQGSEPRLEAWLDAIGCTDAWQRSWSASDASVLLADGPSAAQARMGGLPAIELSFPADPIPAFLPEPWLGGRGAVRLVEQIARAVLG
jgi:nitrogenase molybdenum-iron protein alpha/beta subunit